MELNRVWSMPNRWTFEIKPIRKLIYKYGGDFKGWIDPFAGMNSPAEIRNDLNPEMPAEYHLDALEFLKAQNRDFTTGVLYDPPYSFRQARECYKGVGKEMFESVTSMKYWSDCKKHIAKMVKINGIVICCGWNSNGIGKNKGFKILEILIIAHGGNKNDTIVTVEQKFQDKLF